MGFHKFRWWLCRSSNTSFCSSLAFKVEVSVHRAVPGIEGNVSRTSGCILEGPTAAECLCFAVLYCLKCKRIMNNLSKTVWLMSFSILTINLLWNALLHSNAAVDLAAEFAFLCLWIRMIPEFTMDARASMMLAWRWRLLHLELGARWEAWCCEDYQIWFRHSHIVVNLQWFANLKLQCKESRCFDSCPS